MKSRCLLNSCNSTSQFISIMFRCSFFFLPNKELPFSSVSEPYMIKGICFHGHPLFNGPLFMTPPFSGSQTVVTLPLFPPPHPLLISDKSLILITSRFCRVGFSWLDLLTIHRRPRAVHVPIVGVSVVSKAYIYFWWRPLPKSCFWRQRAIWNMFACKFVFITVTKSIQKCIN